MTGSNRSGPYEALVELNSNEPPVAGADIRTTCRVQMHGGHSKTLRAVLLFSMLIVSFGTTGVVQAATSSLTVDSLDIPTDLNVNPGEAFTFDLVVTNQTGAGGFGQPGLSANTIDLQYDDTVISITDASDQTGGVITVVDSAQSSTVYRALGFSAGGTTVVGTFTLLRFTATAANNPGGNTSLTMSVVDYGDENADDIAIGGDATRPKNIVASGEVTINTPPSVSFQTTSTSVVEGDAGTSNVVLTLVLGGQATTSAVTADITLTNVTATIGDDYHGPGVESAPGVFSCDANWSGNTCQDGTVTITGGATSTVIQIPVKGDTLDEANETFQVTIDSASAGTAVGTPNTFTVTIIDNDAPPTVSMAAAAGVLEGTAGVTSTASFLVTLSALSGLDVVVWYDSVDGTATTGSGDYKATSTDVTIPVGQLSAQIDVDVTGDTTFEDDETFTVTAAQANTGTTTAPIIDTTTVVTIQNDDDPVVANDAYNTNEDTLLNVTTSLGVLNNDPSAGDAILTVAVVDDVSTGTLALAPDGSFTYTPDQDTNGTDVFTYRATFTGAGATTVSGVATTTITVNAVNDAPVANNDVYNVVPFQVLNSPVSVLANDTDVDDVSLTAVLKDPIPGGEGTLTAFNLDGSFTYDPELYIGPTSFTYYAFDGQTSSTATVLLTQGPNWRFGAASVQSADEDANGILSPSNTVNIVVELQQASTTDSTVDFYTMTGASAATADVDYTAIVTSTAPSITLNSNDGVDGAGVASTTIQVTILNDPNVPIREGQEAFYVVLSNPSPDSNVAGGQLMLAITIDDLSDIPTVSVVTPSEAIEDSSATTVDVTVQLTGRSNITSTVQIQTQGSTSTPAATGGSTDYVDNSTTITFGAQTLATITSTTFTVTYVADTIDEFDEIFEVAIFNGTEQGTGRPLSEGQTVAVLTITDNDDAPTVAIDDVTVSEPDGTATFTLTLTGASSGGVSVDVESADNTATGGGTDYTFVSSTVTWEADESGTKQVVVNIDDDAIEEDAETAWLNLLNLTTTNASAEGVSATDAQGLLTIKDDEPAAAVVAVTSMGEALPGDWYYLIVAGSASPALSVSSINNVQLTAPWAVGLTPTNLVSQLVMKTFKLGELRSKAVTHVYLAQVTSTQPQGTIQFTFQLNYDFGGPVVLGNTGDIGLDIVGSRSNRNFYLFPGSNFTGLGLIPDDTSIANVLAQPAPNVYPGLAAALGREATLADVVQTVFAYDNSISGNNPWLRFDTAVPFSNTPAATPTSGFELEPFQGMIVQTRVWASPNASTTIHVFDQVNEPGFGTTSVPVMMNIVGPFLDPSATVPVSSQLNFGFNLLAPHVSAPTPFDTAFGGSGTEVTDLYSSAVSRLRSVVGLGGSPITAVITERFVTESPAIPPFVAPGTIDPTLSYWVKVESAAQSTKPTLTASGPNSEGPK